MSDAKHSNRRGLFIAIGLALLLALLYAGGGFFLPAAIQSAYHGKNCSQALGLGSLYADIYPAALLEKNLSGPLAECRLYASAADAEMKKAWQDSYNAYQGYVKTYPEGLFATEVHEQSAALLVAWSQDLLAQKHYAQAVDNLKLVLKNYLDTASLQQANELMPKVFVAWGADLRSSADFAGSEAALKTFAAWAQDARQAESEKTAAHELAQNYLAWGAALQTQKQFEQALAKLDLATTADPALAAQANGGRASLYSAWGDDLAGKKDFPGAIDHYKTAITLVDAKDQPAARDVVANGYIQWAASLSAAEDFLGALKQLDVAATNAAGDKMKTGIEKATTDTYTAFSKSSGPQAQQAIQDALKSICDTHKSPALPIFGLDPATIRAGIYGVTDPLPANVLAATPASLHYAVCVQETVKVLQSETFEVVSESNRDIASHFFKGITRLYPVTYIRDQVLWDVMVMEIKTATVGAHQSFPGKVPDPFVPHQGFLFVENLSVVQSVHGPKPELYDLVKWLAGVMK